MKAMILVLVLVSLMPVAAYGLECPRMPEQTQKDWEVEVKTAVGKIGPARGAELETKTKAVTKDLMGKLPQADKVYLQQMMLATYCSALRDDKSISETEKGKRIKAYTDQVIKTLQPKPQASKDSEKTAREKPSPDLIAEFVDPDDIHLVISNPTTETANQPKFMTVLFDLSNTPDPLPIPQYTGDYLRGKASLLRIPILHYGNMSVLNVVRPHDTLLGWITLSCANCKRIRWYWLSYEYTASGWYSELSTQPDSQSLWKMVKERNVSRLDEVIPAQKRVPIRNTDGIVRFPEQGPLR